MSRRLLIATLILGSLGCNARDNDGKNNDSITTLHEAAEKNAAKRAKVLLTLGADPNARDNKGKTPLHNAVDNDASITAKILLEHGAKPNARNWIGSTPLHWAALSNAAKPQPRRS